VVRQRKPIGQQRGSLVIPVVSGVIIAALIVAAFFGVRNAQKSADREQQERAAAGNAAPPPWPLPTNPVEQVQKAGLPVAPEGAVEHYHAHLSIVGDGKQVPIPANVGIAGPGAMSPLHVHSDDGIIHIEAVTAGKEYTLGQLFTEWNVKLTRTQLGSLKAGNGKTLVAFVNRKRYNGNPALIRFASRQQIDLVFGKDGSIKTPETHRFAKGV
jgi:hypothetical protein